MTTMISIMLLGLAIFYGYTAHKQKGVAIILRYWSAAMFAVAAYIWYNLKM